jgi:hypothetical protein
MQGVGMHPTRPSDEALEESILAALELLDLDELDGPVGSDGPRPDVPDVRVEGSPASTEDAEAQGAVRTASGNRSNRGAVERELRTRALETAKQHQLPADLALAVAAERMTVQAALAARDVRTRNEQLQMPRRGNRAIPLGIALVLALGLGAYIRSEWQSHVGAVRSSVTPTASEATLPAEGSPAPAGVPVPIPPAAALATVTRNAADEIVRVDGPDPRSVLDTYCRNSPGCASGGQTRLVAAALNAPGVRIGIFGDTEDPTLERGIYIHRDPRSRRWSAGNGLGIRVVDPSRSGDSAR